MENSVEIMDMTMKYIDDVVVVESLSFKIPWSKNSFIEEIKNNKFARYIVAGIDGKIVGYAGMWKVFDEGHITNVAVHPEYRGRGIGSALVKGLIQIAAREEITSMTLEVRESNSVAQKLYSRHGFVNSGERKNYYSDNGENAIIMWKNKI